MLSAFPEICQKLVEEISKYTYCVLDSSECSEIQLGKFYLALERHDAGGGAWKLPLDGRFSLNYHHWLADGSRMYADMHKDAVKENHQKCG